MVYLAADTFHYRFGDRTKTRLRRYATEQWPDGIGRRITKDLPLKVRRVWAAKNSPTRFKMVFVTLNLLPSQVGSLQTFVRGFKDAHEYLTEFAAHPLPPHMERKLQLQFERLVVLDYIIRNTDRGGENWLINYKKPVEPSEKVGAHEVSESTVEVIRNGHWRPCSRGSSLVVGVQGSRWWFSTTKHF